MYLLDNDHLSVLERGGLEAKRLRRRLQAIPPAEVAATVVRYEEQTRGWLMLPGESAVAVGPDHGLQLRAAPPPGVLRDPADGL